jgi:hypothetical protein
MKKYVFIIAFILCELFFLSRVNAQDIYRTQNGDMLITAVSGDTVFKVTSKELLILLNYKDASITIKMDKSTFKTGNDSIDKKLALMKDIIEFKGKLDLEFINTQDHPPLDFKVKGILSSNQKTIYGDGRLAHISFRGTYSCLLTLRLNLKMKDLGLNFEAFDLKEDIQIEIAQTVLNKSNE